MNITREEIVNNGQLIGIGSTRDVYLYDDRCYKCMNDFAMSDEELYCCNFNELQAFINADNKHTLSKVYNHFDNFMVLHVEYVQPLVEFIYLNYRYVLDEIAYIDNTPNRFIGMIGYINGNIYKERRADYNLDTLISEHSDVLCGLNVDIDAINRNISKLNLRRLETILIHNIGVSSDGNLVILDYTR